MYELVWYEHTLWIYDYSVWIVHTILLMHIVLLEYLFNRVLCNIIIMLVVCILCSMNMHTL